MNKMVDPIVTIKDGKLKGVVATLLDGSPYYSFKGIPYAQAPTGNARFKAPLPTKPWNGVRDATQHGPICTQYDLSISKLIEGSEECLFVNVYTKSLNAESKMPVMVFIHGGSYSYNSGNSETFSPDLLLRHDVILVTMNYRLELLGYLCLDTPEVPGNAGMKDQSAALLWVKKNIAKFGGDPDNITIFGESSGASSVTSHMLSPMSRGLFNKVIAQSGTTIHDWAIDRNAKKRAFRAGKLLGIETNDTDELLAYLRSLNATLLTNLAQKTMTFDETYRGLPDYFIPVVEKKFEGVEAFLDEEPLDLLVKGKVAPVPLMIGYNSAEDLVLIDYLIEKLDVYNREPSYFITKELAETVDNETLKKFGERLRQFYVGGRNLTKDDPEIIERIGSDIHFFYNSHRFANFHSAWCHPVYMYRFNYDTELNIIKNFTAYAHLKGASHADELFYMFYNFLNKKPYDEHARLRELALKVTTLWTNFAKTGNPTPDCSLGVDWLPYTLIGKEYLKIEDDMKMGNYADIKRMMFWNELYKEAGVPHIA
ncbi:esterase FE4-like isoform X2 [Battus philenor]|uniref:esterase FE4-like isoform X2 n=1 Tax=Battus philenor TaxID=42288 RepID=UPI0035D123BE